MFCVVMQAMLVMKCAFINGAYDILLALSISYSRHMTYDRIYNKIKMYFVGSYNVCYRWCVLAIIFRSCSFLCSTKSAEGKRLIFIYQLHLLIKMERMFTNRHLAHFRKC